MFNTCGINGAKHITVSYEITDHNAPKIEQA